MLHKTQVHDKRYHYVRNLAPSDGLKDSYCLISCELVVLYPCACSVKFPKIDG